MVEKLEGVDLTKLVEAVDNEISSEKQKEFQTKIRYVRQNMFDLAMKKLQLERELKKVEVHFELAKAKIEKIKNGDWGVFDTIVIGKKDNDNQQ